MQKVRKAILPVAGLGTRFLPATKSIPKEILTLVDRPLIQYAIDEAREAGIEEFIFVTSKGKSALEDYFDGSPHLEASLLKSGKTDLLEVLQSTNMESGEIVYVRQRDPLGLGHAVWCARSLIGDEPFAVLLPDDVIAAEKSCLHQMVDAYREAGGNMVATMEVPPAEICKYGVLEVEQETGPLSHVSSMVEKPAPGTEPSNLAVIGRYILDPKVMKTLDNQAAGSGGEIQLTDAIAAQISDGHKVFGYKFSGHRYDCGSKAGYLQATVAFGLSRPELRDEFQHFLDSLSFSQKAAE